MSMQLQPAIATAFAEQFSVMDIAFANVDNINIQPHVRRAASVFAGTAYQTGPHWIGLRKTVAGGRTRGVYRQEDSNKPNFSRLEIQHRLASQPTRMTAIRQLIEQDVCL